MNEKAIEEKDIVENSGLEAPLKLSKNFEPLIDTIENTTAATKKLQSTMANETSAKKVQESTKKIVVEQNKLTDSQNKLSESVTNSNKEQGKEQEQFKKTTNRATELKKELKELEGQMALLAEASGEDTEAFRKLANEAGEIKDKLGDIREATSAVSGEPIERLGGSFELLKGKLKGLDFKGATSALKQMTSASKSLNFKESIKGVADFSKQLLQLILKNPFLLIVAAVIALGVAIYKLRDSLIPLQKAFKFVGDIIAYTVQQLKDFSDWLGLSAFAAEDKADRIIAASEKEMWAINRRYDQEIKLLKAAGKETFTQEKLKQLVIIETQKKIIAAIEAEVAANAMAWDKRKEQYEEAVKAKQDALVELQVIDNEEDASREKKIKKAIDDEYLLAKFRLEQAIKTQEAIVATLGKAESERTAASVKGENLRQQLAKLVRDHELKEEGITLAKRTLIQEQAIAVMLDNEKGGSEQRLAIETAALEYYKSIQEKRAADANVPIEKRLIAQQEAYEAELTLLEIKINKEKMTQAQADEAAMIAFWDNENKKLKLLELAEEQKANLLKGEKNIDTSEELSALNQRYTQGLISTKDYLAQKRGIEEAERKFELQQDIKLYEALLDLEDKAGLDTTERRRKLAEMKLKIDQEAGDKELAYQTELTNLKKQLAQESYASILAIADNAFEGAQMQRDKDLEALTRKHEEEVRLVGDNKEAKAKIDNQFAVEQEKMRQQQVAADRKKAQFDKLKAALDIGINTGIGISKAVAALPLTGGLPFSAIVAAIGAVQLAAVLSRPIPSYAGGTDYHPGGLARFGEAGAEKITLPTGQSFIATDETIAALPTGTKVKSNKDTMMDIAMGGLNPWDSTVPKQPDNEVRALRGDVQKLIKVTENKKAVHINYSKRGVEALIQRGNSIQQQLGDQYL